MSSLTLWKCPITGVSAIWNKGDQHTVFVPTHREGIICHGEETRYASERAALRAAKEKAYDLILERHQAAPVVVLQTNCAPVVEGVLSTIPGLRVVIVDADLEGCDDSTVANVEGVDSWIGLHTADHDPARVAAIVREIDEQLGSAS